VALNILRSAVFDNGLAKRSGCGYLNGPDLMPEFRFDARISRPMQLRGLVKYRTLMFCWLIGIKKSYLRRQLFISHI
jgi:hypothetical protein